MKKIIPWILAAIFFSLFVSDRITRKADLEELVAPYKVQKAADAVVIAGLREDVKKRDENIDLLNGELDSNSTVIAALKKKAVDAEAGVVEARKGWAAFSLEAQAKLAELDNAWSARFSLAQDEIRKWEEREVAWVAKEDQYKLKVSDLEAIIAAKDRTNKACEDAQAKIGRELIKARRASALKNWVALAAGGLGFVLGKA